MEEDFNLSEKRIIYDEATEIDAEIIYYLQKDVKEFIKRLKIDMHLTLENYEIIDKLCGEKLR